MVFKFIHFAVLFLLICTEILSFSVFAIPLISTSIQSNKAIDPEEAAGMVEGDMLLSDEQELWLKNPPIARNGLIAETKRWPNATVYYKIIGDFDAVHYDAIIDAMEILESRTCIQFQEANESTQHYVEIMSNSGGCYTAVGYQATVQPMNLQIYPIGVGCFRPGTILHEFMHALGFYHEHSSPDRDNYIDVMWENIVPGKELNFKKYSSGLLTDFGVGYDYDSCLHYRAGAFSINGEDTIVPLQRNVKIGQRSYLSKKDTDKINIMYRCPISI